MSLSLICRSVVTTFVDVVRIFTYTELLVCLCGSRQCQRCCILPCDVSVVTSFVKHRPCMVDFCQSGLSCEESKMVTVSNI